LASGVRELIQSGREGFLPAIGDIAGFAGAIEILHGDRNRVEAMSTAARERVVRHFDIRDRVRDYQDLFARHREFRRPRPDGVTLPYGSRLDQPWIPNVAVKTVRSIVRRAAGKPA
jgi:hypothetical protein